MTAMANTPDHFGGGGFSFGEQTLLGSLGQTLLSDIAAAHNATTTSVKHLFSTTFFEIIDPSQCYQWKHRKELAAGRLLHLPAKQMSALRDGKHCTEQSNICHVLLSYPLSQGKRQSREGLDMDFDHLGLFITRAGKFFSMNSRIIFVTAHCTGRHRLEMQTGPVSRERAGAGKCSTFPGKLL